MDGTGCQPAHRPDARPRTEHRPGHHRLQAAGLLAEASATELSKQRNPHGYSQQTKVAKDGGSVAKAARNQLESQLGRSIISPEKASDYLLPETLEESDN